MNIEIYSLKAGDAVRLKTGGRTMRVDYTTQAGSYNCKWHDGLNLNEGEFSLEELEIINSLALAVPTA